MSSNIRVAAVGSQPMHLADLRQSLQQAKGFSIVAGDGSAADGSAADAHAIAREYRPDILLLDLPIEDGGIQAASGIQAEYPDIRVIILTGSWNDDGALAALSAGVWGYLLKNIHVDDLITVLQNVCRGIFYTTPSMAARLPTYITIEGQYRRVLAAPSPEHRLTYREEQVLALASRGLTNDEISRELGLTMSVVAHRMTKVYGKCGVRNRAKAISQYLTRFNCFILLCCEYCK